MRADSFRITKGFSFVVSVFIMLLISTGCNSKPDSKVSSKTEKQRQALDPTVALFLIRAEDSFRQGAFNAALRLTDSAAVYAPELADIPYLQGLILTEVSQLNKAKAAFERVVSLDPYYRTAWFKLGNSAFRQEQYRKALTMYRKEQQVDREVEKADGQDLDLDRHCTILLQLGRTYTELGEIDSAEQTYLQAIAIDGSYAEAYGDLGYLFKDNGEFKEALKYSRRALSLDPENADYNYLLGSLLLQTGQTQKAIVYLEMVLKRRPGDYGACYNLGQALVTVGRVEEGHRFLAMVDSLQSLQNKINHAKVTAETYPNVLRRWVEFATLLRRAGRYDVAMDAYKVALYLDPKNVTIQRNMANLSLSLGDTTGAINRYRALLGHYPSLGEVWVNLGIVYALSGRLEEARQAWQSALRFQPDHAQAKAWLAKFPEVP